MEIPQNNRKRTFLNESEMTDEEVPSAKQPVLAKGTAEKVVDRLKQYPRLQGYYKNIKERLCHPICDFFFLWVSSAQPKPKEFGPRAAAFYKATKMELCYRLLQQLVPLMPSELALMCQRPMKDVMCKPVFRATAPLVPQLKKVALAPPSQPTISASLAVKQGIPTKTPSSTAEFRMVPSQVLLKGTESNEVPFIPWEGFEPQGDLELLLDEVFLEVTASHLLPSKCEIICPFFFATFELIPMGQGRYRFTASRTSFYEVRLETPKIAATLTLLNNYGQTISSSIPIVLTPIYLIRSRVPPE